MDSFEQNGSTITKYFGDDSDIAIPDGIEQLDSYLFGDAHTLKRIVIPASVKEIEATMFPASKWGATSILEEIIVDNGNPSYKSEGGIVYSKDMTRLVTYPAGLTLSRFEVPETVKTICKSAFQGCLNLNEIILPEGCEIIEEYAFESCENLIRINLNQVREIGEYAFQQCQNLQSAELDNISEVKEWTFHGCWNLQNVKFGNVTSIKDSAFSQCSKLTNLSLPESLKTIGQYAFDGKGWVVVPKSVESIGECSLENFREITIYDNLRGRVSEMGKPYGNARAFSYDVFVKSADDAMLKYVIPMHSDGTGNMYSLLLGAWKEDNTFDFAAVDQYFKSIKEPYIKTKLAMTRLAHPFDLSDEAKKNYESHLKRNAISIVKQLIDGSSGDASFVGSQIDFSPYVKQKSFELSESWGLLKKNNIDELIEYAQKTKNTEWTAFLLDWKRNNAGGNKDSLHIKTESYMVGDVIAFGHYDWGSGEVPMEWVIVDTTKKQYLLASKYWLKAMKFYSGTLKRYEFVGWAESDVRAWLNNDFLDTSFEEYEKSKICVKKLKNSNNITTEDRIFIPSPKEFDKNYWDFEQKGLLSRRYGGPVSPFGESEMSRKTWMRYGNCTLDVEGGNGNLDSPYYIRPMMWINKE